MSMLEYVKHILFKVSFDRRLFRKEYKKSLKWLTRKEAHELKVWLRTTAELIPETVKQ